MSKNPITGDEIATKVVNDLYRDGFDRIWGKKDPDTAIVETVAEQVASDLDEQILEKK